ncbi:MAG: FtsQ-type POTRA domain-containing protein [Bryobacteraceae bacterium]
MRSAAPARRGFSTTRIVTIALAFCVLLIASLYVFHRFEQFLIRDPRFALSGVDGDAVNIEIAGAAHASRARIENVFAIDFGRSVYLLPLTERRETLRSVDWVKDASIARLWPNRVVVSVEERKPVAFLTLAPSRFALIDEDGVILPPAPDRFALPVLTGVRASDALADRRDRVHRMLRLTRELGEEARNVSEIDVSDRDNLKVTAPRDGHIVTLLLGDRDFARRYQNFLNHYAEIKRRLPNAATLDLRLEDRITVVE